MERGHLRDRIVERRPLEGSVGESGAPLEVGRLDDGTPIVIKQINWRDDMGMQATDDRGRAVQLFSSGVLAGLPAGVRDVTLDAWHEDGACTLVMSDVSRALISPERRVSGDECRRIVEALAAVHAVHRGREPLDFACPAAVRMALMSPATMRSIAVAGSRLPAWVLEGWDAFREVVDDDLVEATEAVHRDMQPLADELQRQSPPTLLHGDTWLANLGLLDDEVVLLDWSLATWAPPEVEYSYFLAINQWQIDLSHERILDLCRAAEGDAMSEAGLQLSLFWSLASYGWNKAWYVVHGEDEAVRQRERADLDWWMAAARSGLEVWSP